MRNGRKSHHDQAVDLDEGLIGLKSVAPVPAAAPMMQLGLDSLDPLDDPSEVLIRVSMDALEGEDDLVNEEPDELQDDFDAKVAEAKMATDVRVAAPPEPVEEVQAVAEPEVAEAEAEVVAEPAAEAEAEAEPAVADPAEEAEPGQIQLVVDLDEADEIAAAEVVDFTADLPAQPIPYQPVESLPMDDPTLQIRLARIHLKTGSFTLARAELEALAARDQLDTPGYLNLAEARWRTGDLPGAGEAAAAYLSDGGDEALCLVIAAEAAAGTNRAAESRRFVEQALERHLLDLDPVFAGIRRKATWSQSMWAPEGPPAAPVRDQANAAAIVAEPAPIAAVPGPTVARAEIEREACLTAREESVAAREESVAAREAGVVADVAEEAEVPEAEAIAGVVTEPEPTVPEEAPAADVAEVAEPATEATEATEPPAEIAEVAEPAEAAELPAEPPAEAAGIAAPAPEPEPAAEESSAEVVEGTPDVLAASVEVASGRSYLDAGDPMMAALHFAVAIRLTPTSAQAVLEAIGDRQDLALQLVRGDALRVLGQEGDAGKAYLSVASALGAPKPKLAPVAVAAAPAEPAPETAQEPATAAEPEPAAPAPEPAAPEPAAEPEASAVPEPEAVAPEPPARPVVHELPPIRWD